MGDHALTGYADLVLFDDQRQLCLVSVKKECNPDTQRVVAQLLDYAAALWSKTLDELERDVLMPHLRTSFSSGPLSTRCRCTYRTGMRLPLTKSWST
jgi:hypothetical protein